MKILALELYNVQSSELDKNLKIVLTDLAEKKRIEYWSEVKINKYDERL